METSLRRGVAAVFVAATLAFTAVPAPAQADTSRSRGIASVPFSSYHGKYYSPRHEQARRCIIWRESRNKPTVVNRSSSAGGLYQFTPTTARNVAKMMGRRDLMWVHPSRWSRKSQDQAFWTLWNHGRGRSHWAGGSWRCW